MLARFAKRGARFVGGHLDHQQDEAMKRMLEKGQRTSSRTKLLRRWTFVCGTVAVFWGIYRYYEILEKERVDSKRQKLLMDPERPDVKVGGDFALRDTTGRLRDLKEFRGKVVLLYFGFTLCPEICPRELGRVARVAQILRRQYEKDDFDYDVELLFVSVDPRRDQPGVVRKWLDQFSLPEQNISWTGLGGTLDEVSEVCKKYFAYIDRDVLEEAEETGQDDYLVQHTYHTFIINADGICVGILNPEDTIPQCADKVRTRLPEYNKAVATFARFQQKRAAEAAAQDQMLRLEDAERAARKKNADARINSLPSANPE